jgi:hypothetical protein
VASVADQKLIDARFNYTQRDARVRGLINDLLSGYQDRVPGKYDRGDFRQEALLILYECCVKMDPIVDRDGFLKNFGQAVRYHFEDDLIRPYLRTAKRDITLEVQLEVRDGDDEYLLDVNGYTHPSPEDSMASRDLLEKLMVIVPNYPGWRPSARQSAILFLEECARGETRHASRSVVMRTRQRLRVLVGEMVAA